MAISFVGAATQAIAPNTTEEITLPGSPQEGDIVFVATALDNATLSVPNDGTTNYTPEFTDETAVPDCGVWHKTLGASPESSVFVSAVNNALAATACVVVIFRGVDVDGGIFDQTTTSANSTTGDPNPPSITTQTDNAAILSFGFLDDDNITSCTQSGGSNVTFVAADGPSEETASTMFGWQLQASAGAVDPAAFVTDGTDAWRAVTIALTALVVTGYGNDVNRVSSANIAEINGVATANIAEVNGV
jgi:hypothetical protein